MKRPNRDLLVMVKNRSMTEEAIEREVEQLNRILFNVETIDNLSHCCECIDVNRRRISQARKHMVRSLRDQGTKPFIFLFTLN